MNRFRYTPIRPLRDVPVMASTFIRPRPRIEITSPSLTSWDAPLAGCQFTCNNPALIALTNLVRDTLKPELATASKRKEATVVAVYHHCGGRYRKRGEQFMEGTTHPEFRSTG